jgi:hypothetical protein
MVISEFFSPPRISFFRQARVITILSVTIQVPYSESSPLRGSQNCLEDVWYTGGPWVASVPNILNSSRSAKGAEASGRTKELPSGLLLSTRKDDDMKG